MIENLKRKLMYRSRHRGCKEMDLILSDFVKNYVIISDQDTLQKLEDFLNENELEIRQWILETKDIPTKYQKLVRNITTFNSQKHLDK